jgi:hypothetical protein
LIPVLEGAAQTCRALTAPAEPIKLAADAGYHSEANLKYLADQGIEGYIADTMFRKRDARFAQAHRHKPPKPVDPNALFRPTEFRFAEDLSHCICPAGKRLYRNGANVVINGYAGVKFHGTQRDCLTCALRSRCLKNPQHTKARQVVFFKGRAQGKPPTYSALMKRKIDSERGREMITRRFATVEPVFGNLRYNKGLNRFTLRGRQKVDGQWKLYCLVHNIEKLAHNGYAKQGMQAR